MSRKLISFALPLSCVLLFSGARTSLAATPITTFGVMATVEAGCNVSAAAHYGSYSTAMTNAASSVSVRCTNIAQYVITVSSLAPTAADKAVTVPVGDRSFPLASLMSYAAPSGFARNIKPNVMASVSADSKVAQPLLVYGGVATGTVNPNPDAISVSIIY